MSQRPEQTDFTADEIIELDEFFRDDFLRRIAEEIAGEEHGEVLPDDYELGDLDEDEVPEFPADDPDMTDAVTPPDEENFEEESAQADSFSFRDLDEEIDDQQPFAGLAEPTSQRGVALAVARLRGPTIRWHSERACFMLFDATHGWTADKTGHASLEIVSELATVISMSAITDDAKGAIALRSKMQSSDFARGAWRILAGLSGVPSSTAEWDPDPLLMGLPGGKVVCLVTGAVRPARPEDMITRQAGCVPDASVPIPRWLAFVSQLASGDDEIIQFLRCWMWLNLTGLTDEQVFVILVGPGGNGKSVFARIMALIAGTYAGTLDAGALCASAVATRHPTDLAGLVGCRTVNLSEIEPGMKLAESRIKQMTGQDVISARFLHRDFFEYVPAYKLTMTVNDIPRLVGSNKEAMRRRLRCVPCRAKPVEIVKGLAKTLFALEGPGIMAWILGAADQARIGLPVSMAIEAETETSIDAASWADDDAGPKWMARAKRVVELFLSDMTESIDNVDVGASELFAAFEPYLLGVTTHQDDMDVGTESMHSIEARTFGMIASGLLTKKRTSRGNRYCNIRLREIDDVDFGSLVSRKSFEEITREIRVSMRA